MAVVSHYLAALCRLCLIFWTNPSQWQVKSAGVVLRMAKSGKWGYVRFLWRHATVLCRKMPVHRHNPALCRKMPAVTPVPEADWGKPTSMNGDSPPSAGSVPPTRCIFFPLSSICFTPPRLCDYSECSIAGSALRRDSLAATKLATSPNTGGFFLAKRWLKRHSRWRVYELVSSGDSASDGRGVRGGVCGG